MRCAIDPDLIKRTQEFHGHSCPGLAIGIRVSELALDRLGHARDVDLVAVTETDMCGVDAIQFLTGCSVGKGNLIHRDYGKMAFSFHDRDSGQGFRAVLRPGATGKPDPRFNELNLKEARGELTPGESDELWEMRRVAALRVLDLSLEDMFTVTPPLERVPRDAAILKTMVCDACGEGVMESRVRLFGGKALCLPCFVKVEQKI